MVVISQTRIWMADLYDDLPLHVEIEPRKKQKLIMHKDETLMTRNKFQIQVKPNPGKKLNMGYDKRVIVTPTVPMEECTQVYTLPHGHKGALARGINDWFKDSTLKGEDRMNIVNCITSYL
jgi:hypothetical protein